MIALLLENVPFEQDIRELCMAFFPGESYIHMPSEDAWLVLKASGQDEFYKIEICTRNYLPERIQSFESALAKTRFETKNILKRKLYRALEEIRGEGLPWGTLTGIRPTKIAMEMLEAGESIESVISCLKKEYLVSPEKAELCAKTAYAERNILSGIDYQNGWSLYIGIPFCPTRCAYCSFTAYPIALWDKNNATDRYIEALCEEIREMAKIMQGRKLQTIYMGGGTPTAISAKQLDLILTCIKENHDMTNVLEFTIEAGRADSITKEKLSVMREHGIDRISVNPQTMKQETLDIIGRHHTVQEVLEKYALARNMGFSNINMDIIMGLPDEELSDVENTLEKLKELRPDSLTVHSLAIKRAARLNTEKEEYDVFSIKNTWEMLHSAAKACKEMGLEPYYLYRQKNMAGNFENIGYSMPGKECMYNILIMEEKQTIVACGAGTSSKIVYPAENRIERVENVKDPKLYIERLQEMIERKKAALS